MREHKIATILSIDGGGMRGIMPAIILAEIERCTGKPVSELFDLVAGTSTGGILATCLLAPNDDGIPKFSAKDLVKIYQEDGPKIFSHSLWRQVLSAGSAVGAKYSSDGMKEVLDRRLGKLRLSDALSNLLVPAYEIEMGYAHFFTRRDAQRDAAHNFLLQQVVLSTIAAPTFFEPYVIEMENTSPLKHLVFADGALAAANPTMCAYTEAKTLFPEATEYLVVSLGTGKYPTTILHETIKGWGAVQWVRPLLNIMLFGSVDVVDHQMKTLFHTAGDRLNHYYRFQVPIEESPMTVDRAGELDLHALELVAENYIRDSRKSLDELCKKLVGQ